MVTAIIAGLQSMFSSQPGPNPNLHATSIRNFVHAQNYSGWYSLMLGHIPITLFNSLTVLPKMKRDTWVSRLIASLYTFHKSIWTARNLQAHESHTTVDQTLVSLQTLVNNWYSRQHELTHTGRSLLPEDQSSIYHLSATSLAELNSQLTHFHSLWKRQPRSTQDIRAFFKPASRS